MLTRLAQFIEYKHLSVRAFEISIGASDGMLRRAIKNSTDIQSKWLSVIAEKYHDLNIYWLLTGKGDMLKNDSLIYIPPKKVEPSVIYRDNPEKDEIIQLQREQIQLLKEKLSQFDSPNLVDARFGDPALVAEPLNPTPKRATKRNI